MGPAAQEKHVGQAAQEISMWKGKITVRCKEGGGLRLPAAQRENRQQAGGRMMRYCHKSQAPSRELYLDRPYASAL